MLSTQAATLVAKVPYYEDHLLRKLAICKRYYNAFINYAEAMDLPLRQQWGTWNYYSFSIAPLRQDKVKAALKAADIEYSSHYTRSLNREPFVQCYGYQLCPQAEYITNAERVISLPSHWHLNDEQVETVIQTVISSL
jgi:dTDP-4-amino-4,6-dideoxygalactose transaminase